ncbi:MAG: hypothetical protein EOO44_18025 [Flavobacterium sp.]|nr:MAG: hypothetical protein EOO44_18025 [Flavobacterium sp.]
MKTILISALIALAVFFILRQIVYKPYMWKKAINSKEHQLQVGSFIFSKQRGSNGSQSSTTYYFVFKVIEIKDDYVRLSVIRRLSQKGQISQGDFSTTSADYKSLKQNVKKLLITPILSEDLYKGDGPRYSLNDYLLEKYPDLKKSRYYYEDHAAEYKSKISSTESIDMNIYFEMVYSKKEIIENGKLTPWTMTNSFNNQPSLSKELAEKIDLILNL